MINKAQKAQISKYVNLCIEGAKSKIDGDDLDEGKLHEASFDVGDAETHAALKAAAMKFRHEKHGEKYKFLMHTNVDDNGHEFVRVKDITMFGKQFIDIKFRCAIGIDSLCQYAAQFDVGAVQINADEVAKLQADDIMLHAINAGHYHGEIFRVIKRDKFVKLMHMAQSVEQFFALVYKAGEERKFTL